MKRTNILQLTVILTMTAFFATACDPYQQDDYIEQVVVQSWLIADEPLPMVKLSRTIPIEEVYSFDRAAISNAQVEVRLLSASGQVERTYMYAVGQPGIYAPIQGNVLVEPLRRYELLVRIAGKPDVMAQTLVPGRFQTVSQNNTRIKYQSTEQLELEVTRSLYPGRQNYYVFTIETLDPENAELTPFYADILDANQRKDVYLNQSGILFEANTELNPVTNTLKFRLPWIGVAFYGPTRITTNAIDDAMYNFIRTKDVQLGGSTLSPGEINNVATNVSNGIGVFGSYARSSIEVIIEK
jgi:hypothetical protein